MNIVLVLTTGEGGLPHYTAELANALSKQERHDISVILPEKSSADGYFSDRVQLHRWFRNPEISFPKISNLEISPRKVMKSTASFRNIAKVRSLEPDIIHFTHKPHSYTWPLLSNIDVECPIIETRHETENDNLLKIPGRDVAWQDDLATIMARNVDSLIRHMISGLPADGHIVHTDKNKKDLLEKYDNRMIKKIPHGAFNMFGESTASSSDPHTLLFFGNITGSKGLSQVVDSTIKASDEIDDLTTIVAGSGKISDPVEKKIRSNPDSFELRNEFIPNEMVAELFTRASAVIIPHRKQQGHSGTMTIAFSHGKPIIATNVGEFDELVRKNGSGYIVEPGDVEAMRNAICGLLNNEDLRQKMGENSKAVGEELSWEKVAVRTSEYYSKLRISI
jgi:glycosyltransferase involved in cell wall biosynthesis